MELQFSKMHGLGNDFMVIDLVTQSLDLEPQQIQQWADRHEGIGFDQLLVVEPPSDPNIDFRYRIYNADGSEAEQCGNGARCFAKFVVDTGLTQKQTLTLETNTGRISTIRHNDNKIEVNMGQPKWQPEQIPFQADNPSLTYSLRINEDEQRGVEGGVEGGMEIEITPINIGNPHAVIYVENITEAPVEEWGSQITRHPRFPEGVNVGFCQVIDRNFVRLRVFERGVGETRACGSGACAAVVAGILHDKLDNRVKVSLPGGKVRIVWQAEDAAVKMTGPAALTYQGHIQL